MTDHWFMQNEKVLEAMEITSDTTRTVLVWYFRGGKHDILPQMVYESKCQG